MFGLCNSPQMQQCTNAFCHRENNAGQKWIKCKKNHEFYLYVELIFQTEETYTPYT